MLVSANMYDFADGLSSGLEVLTARVISTLLFTLYLEVWSVD